VHLNCQKERKDVRDQSHQTISIGNHTTTDAVLSYLFICFAVGYAVFFICLAVGFAFFIY
jgi:inner membrane protein involved in colicin E2 resistance